MEPDSAGYVNLATNLLENQIFSTSTHPPFELNFFRTPGYPFFLALLKYLGVGSPYWVVFWQELLYCFSLWLFYHFSRPLFGKTIASAGLLFLLIEPGSFAFPKFILSEVLFLPFVITGIFLVGHYLKKRDWHYLVLSGFIMGLGVLVRPALLYFPIIIFFTLITFDFRCKKRWLHAGLLLLVVTVTVSPWVVRNQLHFGKPFISGQQSNMFANYHVPIVWETAKGIPFEMGRKIIAKEVKNTIKQQEQWQGQPLSQIEKYNLQQIVALNELSKYPVEYGKQWIVGVLKTMMGTNLSAISYALNFQYDKVSFTQVQELSFINNVYIFLKAQDKLTLLVLMLRGVLTVFAMLGIIAIIKNKHCFGWIMMLANFYFMCLAGPMADSRFRSPVEAFWFVQACFGFIWIMSCWKRYISKG